MASKSIPIKCPECGVCGEAALPMNIVLGWAAFTAHVSHQVWFPVFCTPCTEHEIEKALKIVKEKWHEAH